MFKLRRLHVDTIGVPDNRFVDLCVDATDLVGEPCDTIVWLRNGAGKTTMLSLLLALVLPDRRDFLAFRTKRRTLEDLVGGAGHRARRRRVGRPARAAAPHRRHLPVGRPHQTPRPQRRGQEPPEALLVVPAPRRQHRRGDVRDAAHHPAAPPAPSTSTASPPTSATSPPAASTPPAPTGSANGTKRSASAASTPTCPATLPR
jgi:hypothetical protein